jgi:hypothetical protein
LNIAESVAKKLNLSIRKSLKKLFFIKPVIKVVAITANIGD